MCSAFHEKIIVIPALFSRNNAFFRYGTNRTRHAATTERTRTMKNRHMIFASVLCLLFSAAAVPIVHGAGQVVTGEARDWAKRTIADENARTSAPSGNALAVLYFVNRTARAELDPLQKGMTLMLLTDLAQVPGLQLLERIKLQALAEELGIGSSGLVDTAAAPRVGKLVGARWIAGGDFAAAQNLQFETQARLVTVETSASEGQIVVPGVLDDILQTEKELVFRIVKLLKINLQPEVAAALRIPCSKNLQALNALFKGVDASDRGDYQRAGDLYREAKKADPTICVASEALDELVDMGKYPGLNLRKGGSITRSNLAELRFGETTTYTVTTDPGYRATVTGCNGTLRGNIYTTGPVTGNCEVSATFDIIQYAVTGIGSVNGSITPARQMVDHGTTATFAVTPDSGYTATVTGCNGTLKGSTYTTGTITGNCAVSAAFTLLQYPVTAIGNTNGSITPARQLVDHGSTTTFRVTPNSGYRAKVTGCGGRLKGAVYTTGPIISSCEVSATFVLPPLPEQAH